MVRKFKKDSFAWRELEREVSEAVEALECICEESIDCNAATVSYLYQNEKADYRLNKKQIALVRHYNKSLDRKNLIMSDRDFQLQLAKLESSP